MTYYLTLEEMEELRKYHGKDEMDAMFEDLNIKPYESQEAFRVRLNVQLTTDNASWTANKHWDQMIKEMKPYTSVGPLNVITEGVEIKAINLVRENVHPYGHIEIVPEKEDSE